MGRTAEPDMFVAGPNLNKLMILLLVTKQTSGETTQHVIAKGCGLSVGIVNRYILRFEKEGLLKLERVGPRTIRYFVTRSGFKMISMLRKQLVIDAEDLYTLVNWLLVEHPESVAS